MLRHQALQALLVSDPDEKAIEVQVLDADSPVDASQQIADRAGIPGRNSKPQLVPHAELKHRSMATLAGRAALIHALAHIEANAVNLAS